MALTLCYGCVTVCLGQTQLKPRDAQFLDRMNQELSLTPDQRSQLDSLYLAVQVDLSALSNEIDTIESSDAPEKEISMRVAIKTQEKKDLKEARETELLRILSESQRVKYEAEVKPAKPQVLHFGIHNRADCKVCVQ